MTADKCVVLVANRGFGIWNSRELLIRRLKAAGWRVVAAAAADRCFPLLEQAGAEIVEIPFREGGFNPVADLAAYRHLVELYRRVRPSLVHHFNAKPIVYGGLAARWSGVPRVVATVTGAGYAFSGGSVATRVAAVVFRSGLARTDRVIFQNPDDAALFLEHGIVSEDRVRMIVSSGVDVVRFQPAASRPVDPTFLMVTRLLWQKGVPEYAAASALVKEKFPRARFLLGGEEVPGRADAVSSEWIQSQVQSGNLEYIGYVHDMPAALKASSAFVFPSRYREGVPRVLLEAAATGIPVVTSDSPGCREAIRDNETGFLVPPGDIGALASAMMRIAGDAALSKRLGTAGRAMVEQEFVQSAIVDRMLAVYEEVGA